METAIIILVVIDIGVSIFIVITGGQQHDRIENKVDWLIDAQEAADAKKNIPIKKRSNDSRTKGRGPRPGL